MRPEVELFTRELSIGDVLICYYRCHPFADDSDRMYEGEILVVIALEQRELSSGVVGLYITLLHSKELIVWTPSWAPIFHFLKFVE